MAVSPARVLRIVYDRLAGPVDGTAQSSQLEDHWRERDVGLGPRRPVVLVSGGALATQLRGVRGRTVILLRRARDGFDALGPLSTRRNEKLRHLVGRERQVMADTRLKPRFGVSRWFLLQGYLRYVSITRTKPCSGKFRLSC